MKDLNFASVIEALNNGVCAGRKSWNSENAISDAKFIFKQVPAEISIDVVPKMQSLPESAKNIFKRRFNLAYPGSTVYDNIKYSNQIVIVDSGNNITYYTPTGEDIFANDWFIL